MKQKYITSFSLISVSLIFSACVKKFDPEATWEPGEAEVVDLPKKQESHPPGVLKVSFENDRASIEYTIDPNDEDLYIQFTGGEIETEPLPGQARENLQPFQITQTVQTPAPAAQPPAESVPELETSSLDEDDKDFEALDSNQQETQVGIPDEDATDRVLSDIRKAQQALYSNELGKAEKLVRNSLGIRETADGFALLGTIHYMRKDNPRAIDAWQRSLAIDPAQNQIKKMITKLESKVN